MMTFAIAALVLIMLPGPDQALITRNALVGGRYGGLLTMLGGVLGLTVHATAAALGLSALLLASATAFTVLARLHREDGPAQRVRSTAVSRSSLV
jgi:threonine/homoserine/homoserine lactone efflux protein